MKGLLISAAILIFASLLSLSSIAPRLFYLQLLWVLVGIGIVAFLWFIDWRSIVNYEWFVWGLYLGMLLLLAIVLFEEPLVRNVRSWIGVGPLSFQPVEFAKIALIVVYASYFSRRYLSIARLETIFISFIYFVMPAALVILQPDLGSVLVLFGIWMGFLITIGLPLNRLLLLLLTCAVAGVIFWNIGLETYQKERIFGVFFPERDALGINYSVIQSKIAIGSAGFWGKGYGQGSQVQLGFLPEAATDFIFAALIEEWGLVAGFIVVGAFLSLIVNILRIALKAPRNFEKFVAVGSAFVFGWQFFLNAGSASGIFPVVGITFPFLSYGGSSLLTSFLLLAIVNSIGLRS